MLSVSRTVTNGHHQAPVPDLGIMSYKCLLIHAAHIQQVSWIGSKKSLVFIKNVPAPVTLDYTSSIITKRSFKHYSSKIENFIVQLTDASQKKLPHSLN